MNQKEIEKVLTSGFKREIFLKEKRPGLYQVFVPFFYPDGDMLEIFLRVGSSGKILIEDLGLTLMKLSYDFELNTDNKRKYFNEILKNYQVEERSGALQCSAPSDNLFVYLMNFIQVVIKVSDLNFLRRENVQSLFFEYFDNFVFEKLKMFSPVKEYYAPFDLKNKLYPSPYAILKNGGLPLCFFPISNDDHCTAATITALNYEKHNFKANKIAIFEDQSSISRLSLAKLTDSFDRQFSSLDGNEERIIQYVNENLD